MLHVRHCLVALALGTFPLGCTPIGCSGEDPELDKPADEQFVGAVEQKLPAPVPGTPAIYGTWIGARTAGPLDMVVLMTNGQFHTSKSVVCVKAPCDPIVQNGTFKLYTREERAFIELQPAPGEWVRYEYEVTSDKLRLRPLVAGSEWFMLAPAGAAWCAGSRECNYQNLPPGVCAGAYECEKNACVWTCPKGGEPSVAPEKDTTGAVNPGDSKTP